MVQHRFWRRLAGALRRMPWIMAAAHVLIRILQPKYTVGVVAVIFNAEGRVLLVEHVFHPLKPWGLPGGWMRRNESPTDAVERELQEELELGIEIGRLLLVELSERNHLDVAYLCHQAGSVGKLSSELLDYGWFDPLDMPILTQFHYRAIRRALEIANIQRK